MRWGDDPGHAKSRDWGSFFQLRLGLINRSTSRVSYLKFYTFGRKDSHDGLICQADDLILMLHWKSENGNGLFLKLDWPDD